MAQRRLDGCASVGRGNNPGGAGHAVGPGGGLGLSHVTRRAWPSHQLPLPPFLVFKDFSTWQGAENYSLVDNEGIRAHLDFTGINWPVALVQVAQMTSPASLGGGLQAF